MRENNCGLSCILGSSVQPVIEGWIMPPLLRFWGWAFRIGFRSARFCGGAAEGGYHSFQPLWDWIVAEEPDLPD
jgi:hypothetical protein